MRRASSVPVKIGAGLINATKEKKPRLWAFVMESTHDHKVDAGFKAIADVLDLMRVDLHLFAPSERTST